MAITWGSEVKDGTNGMRLGYEFSQSPSTVGTGTSSVTVTLKVYFWSRYSVSDSTNSYSITGDFSGSGSASISHGGSGGTTLIRTLTRAVTPSYSATVRSDFDASITGINAIPGTARTGGAWYTAKRPIVSPDNHASITATRSSDTRQNVSWVRTNPTDASKPYQTQELRRWDIDSGDYKTIANLSGSATSYVDSSTKANSRYRYAIRAKNTAGSSSFVYSNYLSTTQAAPTSVKATKIGGDIRITWVAQHTSATAYEIWHAADGVWGGSPLATFSGASTYTHSSPSPSQTHAYRLRVKSDEPNLTGAYSSTSNTVQLLTNPAAPSKLAPSSTALDVSDQDLILTWQHNSIDSTEQTGYNVQYRLDGGAWVTLTDLASSIERRTILAGTIANGQIFEWQVRTYGEYATAPAYSPWSSPAVITLSAKPAATITAPISVVNSSRATVEWLFFDDEGSAQTSYRVRLQDSLGTVLYNRTFNGSAGSLVIPNPVADGATYTVVVSVRDGDGVWSLESSQVFTVDYADPPIPTIEASWDVDLGAVVVLIEHPAPAVGEVDVDHCQVWRSANAEDWVLIADGVPPSTAVTDYIPALDTVNYYRVTTVSALPSSKDSVSVPVVTDSEGWIFINGDPLIAGSFSSVMKLRYNPAVDVGTSRDRVRHHFAGRARPVEFSGEAENVSISLTTDLLDDSATKEDAEAFAKFPAPLCYRDPGGRRLFVSINDVRISNQPAWYSLSMTLEQVDHSE